jgi:lipoprotein-anchoring transpeptidase ErfK/SrfK
MKRAALVAGVSVVALMCAWAANAAPAATQSPSSSSFGFFSQQPFAVPAKPADGKADNKAEKKPEKKPEKKSKSDSDAKSGKAVLREADKGPPIPKGLLHVIVSLDKQRATLFADGVAVAQSKISSGTPTHPTPMGVFNILQKNRHHVSNLYDAPMPYMQRITWSGAALHEGPLPGYPASHGCVRLPTEFAQLLWRATKLGARVIIARDEAAPVAIEHERLVFAKAKTNETEPQTAPTIKPNIIPKIEPKPAPRPELISEPKTAPAREAEPIAPRPPVLLKTADASPVLRGATMPELTKPLVTATARNAMAAEQPTKLPLSDEPDDIAMPPAPATTGATPASTRAAPVEALAKAELKTEPVPQPAAEPAMPAKQSAPVVAAPPAPAVPAVAAMEPPRRKGVVSVFISLKQQRLYVRQNLEPLFDAPVTIARPGEPIGTHVYTAMGAKPGDAGLRWTVVSIPSATKPAPEPKTSDNGKKPRNDKPKVKAVEYTPGPLPSPRAALDRITMPQDAVERIAALITPGASLIVSDNKLSGETGDTTDFIVETR